MTEHDKLNLVTNYFSEDWAIEKAMQLLEDYEKVQQPSPTPQAASSAVLQAIRAANMQLVRTGDDEFMLVTYKNAKAQCDGGKCGIGGYCDDCPHPTRPGGRQRAGGCGIGASRNAFCGQGWRPSPRY